MSPIEFWRGTTGSVSIIKHSRGCVMAWGCISASSVWDLVKNAEIINAEKCHQSLKHHAVTSGKCQITDSLVFQHYSDPRRSASAVKACLVRETQLIVERYQSGAQTSKLLNQVRSSWQRIKASQHPKPWMSFKKCGELLLKIK